MPVSRVRCSWTASRPRWLTAWEEDETELNKAWTQLGIDTAALIVDTATDNEENALQDAASILADEYAIGFWQMQADAVSAQLQSYANQYWAAGC